MVGFLIGLLLGAIAGIVGMAILSGRLDDWMEQKNKKNGR